MRDEGPIACLRIPKKVGQLTVGIASWTRVLLTRIQPRMFRSILKNMLAWRCVTCILQVRDMSIADFFGLSPEEASGSVLTNILSRLCLITGETKPSNTAGESAPLVEVALAVPEPPATRSTRRTAARTAAAQTAAKAAAAPPTTRRRTRATKTQAEQQAEALQPEEDTQIAQQPVTHEAEAGAQPSVQAAASKPKVESAAMPPPPWPAPGRRAQRGEVVYSANGKP